MFLLCAWAPAAHGTPTATPVAAWIWSDPTSDGGAHGDLGWVASEFASQGLQSNLYSHLGMASFMATPEVAADMQRRLGGRVDAAERLGLHLDKSVPYIEADVVRNAIGLARDGPTILTVDTGVDSTHPDFKQGNLVANVQPVRLGGLVVGSIDQTPVLDTAGHGTHVAGILAGSGAALGPLDADRGKFVGVYSNGRIASYQATATAEDGKGAAVDTLAALEAFDWAIENRARFDMRVVSNSWGEQGVFDPEHPVNQGTLQLYLAGMVVVFSAGNSGEDGAGTLNKYCVAPWVFCAAAGDLSGARSGFSSYGGAAAIETPWDHPDLTAPGLFIHAANSIARPGLPTNPLLPAESLYTDRSGTSMAAPHIAGVVGLILAENPSLSPDQAMDILTETASPMADTVAKAGAGYLNARLAFNLAVGTTGNRAAFLAGTQVKYAGPASGDDDYRRDAVSVGFDSPFVGSPLTLAGRAEPLWLGLPIAWVMLGVATVAALAGTSFRSRGARREARP